MYPVFSGEKSSLNITHDKKGISKFPYTVLWPFIITTSMHLSFIEKYCSLNLELPEVQAGKTFDVFGKDGLIS